MKLSALIITYNQEKSVAAAVESALMQTVDFDFEVVVAEDHSTDGTREVVQELERRHPEKVRAICRDKNLGANANFIEALSVCRGEYVATLEGDDLWTHPRKLQRQADFLDAHPECSMCCHAVNYVHEDGSQPPHRVPEGEYKQLSNLQEMLTSVGCHTCSYMFRRLLLSSPPDWLRTLWIGDWPIRMLLAEQGYMGYIDEVMAEYRIHPGGVWSGTSSEKQLEGSLQMFRCVRRHLSDRCSAETAWLVACSACRLSRLRELAGKRDEARSLLIEAIGLLLEETPGDQNLIDELIRIVARLAAETSSKASLDFVQLRAKSEELARLKASRFWRMRQFLVSTPGLGPLLRALRRR